MNVRRESNEGADLNDLVNTKRCPANITITRSIDRFYQTKEACKMDYILINLTK